MTVLRFTGHRMFRCEQPCEKPHCMFCEGGLSFCTVCKGGEGDLPTDCPGHAMTEKQRAEVYCGVLDYRRNLGWVDQPNYRRTK